MQVKKLKIVLRIVMSWSKIVSVRVRIFTHVSMKPKLIIPSHLALKYHVGQELPYLGGLEFSQMNSKACFHPEFLVFFFTAVVGILLALQGKIRFTVTLVT